jgi:hypothetical protein
MVFLLVHKSVKGKGHQVQTALKLFAPDKASLQEFELHIWGL